MKIGVIGGGMVGRAIFRSMVEHHDVRVYDIDRQRATHDVTSVMDTDVIFLCLPTPKQLGARCANTSAIEKFLDWSATNDYKDKRFVLKSTVPVGFTRTMAMKYDLKWLVHSPEFLTARCSLTDAMIPSRNIVGLPANAEFINAIGKTISIEDIDHPVIGLYRERFPGTPCYLMTSEESEAVKLVLNGFFAVKVSFFNEVHSLTKNNGLNWKRVMAGVLADGRICSSHTLVPGPDGKHGFGGECLPKDLASLIDCLEDSGDDADICRAAERRNAEDREKE